MHFQNRITKSIDTRLETPHAHNVTTTLKISCNLVHVVEHKIQDYGLILLSDGVSSGWSQECKEPLWTPWVWKDLLSRWHPGLTRSSYQFRKKTFFLYASKSRNHGHCLHCAPFGESYKSVWNRYQLMSAKGFIV